MTSSVFNYSFGALALERAAVAARRGASAKARAQQAAYADASKEASNTLTIPEMAKRLADHDESGAMHVVVSDGNLDDSNIRSCLEQPDVTDDDRDLAADLLAMNEADRVAAWGAAFGSEDGSEAI